MSRPIPWTRDRPAEQSVAAAQRARGKLLLDVPGDDFAGDAVAALVDAVRIARDPEWSSCKVELLGGPEPISVATRHRSARGTRGLLSEELSGMVDVRQLSDWLAGEPRIAVCEVEAPIETA